MEEQRTVFQKTVLVILAAMIAAFGALTGFHQARPGILFRDCFLQKQEVSGMDCFTGKAEGEDVTILSWYSSDSGVREVTLRVGERIHDTYTVYLGEPMIPLSGTVSTLTSTRLEVPTLRITKNNESIFEGGYQTGSGMFYTSGGEWTAEGLDMTSYVSGTDPWANYTMSKGFVVKLALAPELITRGDWRLYALMVCFTLLVMVDVAFPYTMFRWRYRRWVKDPAPTDDYMSLQHLGWVFLPVLLLVGYIWAATTTMAVV